MTHVISLGWNCLPAEMAVGHHLRPDRQSGYKTCPFDLMMSNYDGLLRCLEEDFAGFLEDLRIETFITNSYGFLFNHESPASWREKWLHWWPDANEFVADDYAKLRERYTARIAAFREVIRSGRPVVFFRHQDEDRLGLLPVELDELLGTLYPGLRYRIVELKNVDFECPDLGDRTGNVVGVNSQGATPGVVRQMIAELELERGK